MNSIGQLQRRPELGLTAVGSAAVALFGAISWKVYGHRAWRDDLKLRRKLPRYGKKTGKAAVWFGHLAKEWAVLPVAGAVSAGLWKDNRTAGAVAVAAAAASSVAASHILDAALPKRTPPPGRREPLTSSFPSGHALHSTTLLLTAAYVLSREKLVDPGAVGGLAIVLSAALGVDRLIHDRHWTTDVVAGWLASIALASFMAAGYEAALRRQPTRLKGDHSREQSPRIRRRLRSLTLRN